MDPTRSKAKIVAADATSEYAEAFDASEYGGAPPWTSLWLFGR